MTQRACTGEPPDDGNSVDNPSDEALDKRITVPCECAGTPETVGTPEPGGAPLTLMSLPPELRSMIWWATLAPEAEFVSIVPWRLDLKADGVRPRNIRFHPKRFEVEMAPRLRFTYEREGEHCNSDASWALLRVNREVYEEAENEYWRRAIVEGLMFSFTCHHFEWSYYGIATAWAFFNDCSEQYLQAMRRVHLDLRRTGYYDTGYQSRAVNSKEIPYGRLTNFAELLNPLLDLMGTRLTGLRHLSLTFSGWVPDVRRMPVSGTKWLLVPADTDNHAQWIESSLSSAHEHNQSSDNWVRRLQNLRRLTRLRLRVVITQRNADTILNLSQDPVVLHTIRFLRMLRDSMLVNGASLGPRNMRVWFDQREPFHGAPFPTRIIVQCDDSWDEDTGRHIHHVEDDKFDPLDDSKLYQVSG